MQRWIITACVFAFSFIVNPMYLAGGCVTTPAPAFEYGEAEMVTLLQHVTDAGTYPFSWQGREYELIVVVHEAAGAKPARSATREVSWQARASACGTRTFQQSAAACMDTSELLSEGEATLRVKEQGAFRTLIDAAPVTGSLFMPGLQLGYGELVLHSGAPALHLDLMQSGQTNEFTLVQVVSDGGADPTQAVSLGAR